MLLAGLPTCGCGQSVNGRRLQDELDSLREQNTHTKHTAALMRGHFWARVFSSVSVVFLKEFQLSFSSGSAVFLLYIVLYNTSV